MAGGSLIATSLIPFVLCCVKKKTLLSEENNTAHAQDPEPRSYNDQWNTDKAHHFNDRKPDEIYHKLFVSTV